MQEGQQKQSGVELLEDVEVPLMTQIWNRSLRHHWFHQTYTSRLATLNLAKIFSSACQQCRQR